eukprot:7190790-Pyramimonas_sp.AAC.1
MGMPMPPAPWSPSPRMRPPSVTTMISGSSYQLSSTSANRPRSRPEMYNPKNRCQHEEIERRVCQTDAGDCSFRWIRWFALKGIRNKWCKVARCRCELHLGNVSPGNSGDMSWVPMEECRQWQAHRVTLVVGNIAGLQRILYAL